MPAAGRPLATYALLTPGDRPTIPFNGRLIDVTAIDRHRAPSPGLPRTGGVSRPGGAG